MILSKEKWGLKIFHSFANVSKFWLVFLLVAKNGMLLNSEVLFHRLEKDDMAKRKDRAGLDFNKLVLAMLLQTLFYHVIQNLLVVIPFLFYSFFFGLEVGDGWSGKKVFWPCLGNIMYAGGVWMYVLWCFWYQFVWVLFWSSVMKL